jgi:UDPglucose 6-dehydrogenase/UDP-N-acetyl-D-galactosamine dehydrogenase
VRGKLGLNKAIVAIVGLGYVGLPLAEAFSKNLKVIGFDTDARKVKKLNQGNRNQNLFLTNSPQKINQADFIIICVPTPVTKSKEPDLSHVKNAAETIGRNMKKGSVVILESTVYPGVTEEIIKPILEAESVLKCGEDFKIAYSPERINPGDPEHSINKITKVVAGMDEETTELIAVLYGKVTPHIYKAEDIKTAEAAKVIENIQRDLHIALMNELAMIFEKMGLNTKDVLDAAATKWNFHRYSPGLVGGHCIPVDPYYLVYKARELRYHPQVILAGRAINDHMPKYVAEMTIKALNEVGKIIKGSKVLIMGLAYKEDVPDSRESPVKGIIKELKEYGVEVTGFDPLLDAAGLEGEFNIKLFRSLEEAKRQKVDGIILAVAHSSFRRLSLTELKERQNNSPILIDVRGIFDAEEAKKAGFYYRTL